MTFAAKGQLLQPTAAIRSLAPLPAASSISRSVVSFSNNSGENARLWSKQNRDWSHRNMMTSFVPQSWPGSEGVPPAAEDGGVSLGTMKLPLDTDLPRFESLLFQWANSLCQGANLPLPVPLQVDKIPGGTRLGFITIGDEGSTEVSVYIDCLVYPATDASFPIFRAIRNGRLKDTTPPGEERIMNSLLAALKKSAEIARV